MLVSSLLRTLHAILPLVGLPGLLACGSSGASALGMDGGALRDAQVEDAANGRGDGRVPEPRADGSVPDARGPRDAAPPCTLEGVLDELLAGTEGAISCGMPYDPNERPTDAQVPEVTAAYACAAQALETQTPFRLVVYKPGLDSTRALAWAWRGTGPLIALDYDGDVSGGGGDGNPRLTGHSCEEPSLADAGAFDQALSCSELGPDVTYCAPR